MVINVIIPADFHEERRYALKVLLQEVLGLDYTIESVEGVKDYTLEFGTRRILIRDSFFGMVRGENYLVQSLIPTSITELIEPRFGHILCLYGSPAVSSDDEEIRCDVDLVAGAFFMLTRWEEYVDKTRDEHGRFPAKSSLAYRNGFLNRPVVNEYAVFLKQCLLKLGVPESSFREGEFKLHLHCDVDTALYWRSPWDIFRKLGFRLVKERSAGRALREFLQYLRYLRDGADPYDTYDTLMDLAEGCNSKVTFFFPVANRHELDSEQLLDDKAVQSLFAHVTMRGHLTGLHPSYLSFEDEGMLQSEVNLYRKYDRDPQLHTRQHFLGFEVPTTWRLLDRAGVLLDSTMYYPEAPGFRSGICQTFTVFDFVNKKMLGIKELPLTAMDVTLKFYLNLSPKEAIAECRELLETVRKYNGECVLLWHNSSFGQDWSDWREVPEKIIRSAITEPEN